jgi:hypothetical protein
VGVDHRKLTNSREAARMKKYWAEKLDSLQAYLKA